MPVSFHFQKVVSLPGKNKLAVFIAGLAESEGYQLGALNYVFCSNSYLLKINKDFLNHDYYTDIITFDMSEPRSMVIDGEIYISVDMVKENATLFKVRFAEELRRVMFHGILHLCGYKDKSGRDKKSMRAKENFYLEMFHGEH